MGPDVRRDPEYACRIAHGCLAVETVAETVFLAQRRDSSRRLSWQMAKVSHFSRQDIFHILTLSKKRIGSAQDLLMEEALI